MRRGMGLLGAAWGVAGQGGQRSRDRWPCGAPCRSHHPRRALRCPCRRLQHSGEQEVRGAQDALSNLDAQGAQLDLEVREKEDEIQGLQVWERACGWWMCLQGPAQRTWLPSQLYPHVGAQRLCSEVLRCAAHVPRALPRPQTEKELQSGGEVKELQTAVDEISKRCVWLPAAPRPAARPCVGVPASQPPCPCCMPCRAGPLPRSVVKDTSSWTNKKELLEAEAASVEQLAASLAEVDEEGMRAKMQATSQERDEAQAALNRCGAAAGWGRCPVGAGGWPAALMACLPPALPPLPQR